MNDPNPLHVLIVSVAGLIGITLFQSCRHEDTVNNVPVMRLHILSTRNGGCNLLVENDKHVRTELSTWSGYDCPAIVSGSILTFEVWGTDEYIYKYATDQGEKEETYHETAWEKKLR